jgi:hypothetical protein
VGEVIVIVGAPSSFFWLTIELLIGEGQDVRSNKMKNGIRSVTMEEIIEFLADRL